MLTTDSTDGAVVMVFGKIGSLIVLFLFEVFKSRVQLIAKIGVCNKHKKFINMRAELSVLVVDTNETLSLLLSDFSVLLDRLFVVVLRRQIACPNNNALLKLKRSLQLLRIADFQVLCRLIDRNTVVCIPVPVVPHGLRSVDCQRRFLCLVQL